MSVSFGYRNHDTLQEAVENLIGPSFLVGLDGRQAVVVLHGVDGDEIADLRQTVEGISPVAVIEYGDGDEPVVFTNLYQQPDGSFEARGFDDEEA